MGFIRRQEERIAVRYLQWQYEKQAVPVPSVSELERRAAAIVDEAHRIGRERGSNVVSIIKELIEDLKKK